MAAVVLAAVNGVRNSARAAAIKMEARQLFTLAQMHYAQHGTYQGFSNNHTSSSIIDCEETFHTDEGRAVCESIISRLPGSSYRLRVGCQHGDNNSCSDGLETDQHYSVMVRLDNEGEESSHGHHFCIGSSGSIFESSTPSHPNGGTTRQYPGCIQNP